LVLDLQKISTVDETAGQPASAAKAEGQRVPMILYFDGDCSLCRNLAEFVRRFAAPNIDPRPLSESPQLQREQLLGGVVEPRSIVLFDGQDYYKNHEAWRLLLASFPQLKGLNWLAEKLMVSGLMVSTVKILGNSARKLCRNCGRK
jgi:predicted DCC family thiol-disulfide oxidoreductase YuxK